MMEQFPNIFYPVNDFGPVMKGLAIGGLGIFHVFTAQFAIGGGMLMCYLETLAIVRNQALNRGFIDRYFKVVVLLSFVVGALTGVGMWFTSIQVSPRTIGLMVTEFHWIWGIEWTFFCLEIVAGYAFYRYGARLDSLTRLWLLILYTCGSWFSLFWINGILSWQLTPGETFESGRAWTGFFNPGFWPSLLYRTIASLTVASLASMVIVNLSGNYSREEREILVHRMAWPLAPMVLMPALGFWYLQVLPTDSREWVLGGSVAMTMFLSIAIGSSGLVGIYAFVGLLRNHLYINGATALLLCGLAFGASAGGEFVREGVRKPFTIRQQLYSNSIKPDEVKLLRDVGILRADPYPLRQQADFPTEATKHGALVYRAQCSICHTIDGVNGLVHLTKAWARDQRLLNIAKLQQTKPFMPPFAGTPQDLLALENYLSWETQGRPAQWPELARSNGYVDDLSAVKRWLAEAGCEPASDREREQALRARSQATMGYR